MLINCDKVRYTIVPEIVFMRICLLISVLTRSTPTGIVELFHSL
jgi:hypothetical protein